MSTFYLSDLTDAKSTRPMASIDIRISAAKREVEHAMIRAAVNAFQAAGGKIRREYGVQVANPLSPIRMQANHRRYKDLKGFRETTLLAEKIAAEGA